MTIDDLIESNNHFNDTLLAIEEQKKQLEKQKQELQDFKAEIIKEKNSLYTELSKYSTFDADSIGDAIASFLTVKENEKYKYIICTLNAKKYCGYDYASKQSEYILKEIPIRIIIKEEYELLFKNNIDIEVFRKLLKMDIPVIVIDRNENGKLDKNINLYDREFNLNLNAPFIFKNEAVHYFDMPETNPSQYEAIKDYADGIINYRMKNAGEDTSDNKLYKLLEKDSDKNLNPESKEYFEITPAIKFDKQKENIKVLKKEKR